MLEKELAVLAVSGSGQSSSSAGWRPAPFFWAIRAVDGAMMDGRVMVVHDPGGSRVRCPGPLALMEFSV